MATNCLSLTGLCLLCCDKECETCTHLQSTLPARSSSLAAEDSLTEDNHTQFLIETAREMVWMQEQYVKQRFKLGSRLLFFLEKTFRGKNE